MRNFAFHASLVMMPQAKSRLEGSRDKLIQALSLDPMCGLADFSQLPRLADDLLQANRKWLPRFFQD